LVLDAKELGVAQWVYEHQQMAGLGTATLPSTEALYVPLIASRGVVGVLGVQPDSPRRLLALEQVHLLETFASQTALAIERATLAEETQNAKSRPRPSDGATLC
jgi:two-component system sensor histidine kinase KdpD